MSNHNKESPPNSSASNTDNPTGNEESYEFDIEDNLLSFATDELQALDSPAADFTNYTSQHWNNFLTFLSTSGQDVSQQRQMTTVTLPPINAVALLNSITDVQSVLNMADTYNPAIEATNLLTTGTTIGHSTTTPPMQVPTLLNPLQPITLSASEVSKTLLNIDAFQSDREITSGEAIVYCLKTNKSINVNNPEEVQNAVEELHKLKKNIKETIQCYIVNDILINSKGLTLQDGTTVPTRRIDDLTEVWAQNSDLAEQLWTILIKRYEDMGEWELKVEEQVMKSLNLEYVEDASMNDQLQVTIKDRYGTVTKVMHRKKSKIRGNKGCVAKLATLVKRDLVKQFNRAAFKTHKLVFTSINPVVQINDGGKKQYKKQNIKGSCFDAEKHLKKAKVCL